MSTTTLPYEALARFDDAGKYQGGHTIRRDPATGRLDDPQPIGADKDFPWIAIASEINVATAARVHELETQLSADADAAKTAQEKAVADALAGVAADKAAAEKSASECAAALADLQQFAGQIIDQAEAALTNPALSKEDCLAQLQALVSKAKQPAIQRQQAELDAQIAELQAQKEALAAPAA